MFSKMVTFVDKFLFYFLFVDSNFTNFKVCFQLKALILKPLFNEELKKRKKEILTFS